MSLAYVICILCTAQGKQCRAPIAICMQDHNGISIVHVHAMRLHAARILILALMHTTS